MSDIQTPAAELGQVTVLDDELRVQFRRRFAKPIEKVWAAVTTPERLSDWLALAKVEPQVGGKISLDWHGSHSMDGRVVAYEPPTLFAWTWTMDERETLVRFDLAPDGPNGCWLTLTHTGLSPTGSGQGVRAGWHAHLDGLPDALEGQATAWATVLSRNLEIRPSYPPLF